MIEAAQITDTAKALQFMFGGNSRTTLKSVGTGARYTYKIAEAKDRPGFYFVSLLTGSDNESDFTYMGVVSNGAFRLTSKSAYKADSLPVKALSWALKALHAGKAQGLEIWHEGRCGRCNRALTVPESIESGFGPECITRL